VIFRRKPAAEPTPDAPPETISPATPDDLAAEPVDQWAALDASRDWREDGPFDIDEVDLTGDDVQRVDLEALIVTPEPGIKLQILIDPKSKTPTTLVAIAADAMIQVRVLAAPSTPGYTTEARTRVAQTTAESGATVELAAGPFGTEIRRVLQVTDPAGREGVAPVRDWFVEGPRWVLHAQLGGQAALDTAAQGPAAELEEFFRNLIVRRGDVALVPGAAVPLRAPEQRS
jgi:hypothetical protein